MMKFGDIRMRARAVLEAAWSDERGYCFPNATVYPHLWLWDSCFHTVAWAALGDARCVTELGAALAGQLGDGFVPHMRYAAPTMDRGPLAGVSSFTQPPLYAHAAAVAAGADFLVPARLIDRVAAGLDWLWRHRRGSDGLLVVVHPWETGADDSPRWDSWVGSSDWQRDRWTRFDVELVGATAYHPSGAAASCSAFTAAPAAFNALAADAALELARLTGDAGWRVRGEELAGAIDGELWDDCREHWVDRAVVGGGPSVTVPTLDGTLPALVTPDEHRARRALAALADPEAFMAPHGLRYVHAGHPTYRPDGYWRGSAWMPLHYLALRAALRWEDRDLAARISGAAANAAGSSMAEHWDPESGEGLGADPQTWSALGAAVAQLGATSSPGTMP